MEQVEREPEMARRLPKGAHGIPAEVVARNQRERLVAAMADVCAERGYAEASVAAVAKRAGVSSVTFYKQFAGKRDCLLATHRQLLGRLLEALDRAATPQGESAPTAARAALRTALTLLADDPPAARLLTVEVLAAGPEGAKRHAAAVEALGTRLLPGGAPIPAAGWARVAGVLALIGERTMSGQSAALPELEEELASLLRS